jgi:hypothetical protein
MAREDACCEGGGGILHIPILGTTTLNDLLSSEQPIESFFQTVGDCIGLLGAAMEGITDGV